MTTQKSTRKHHDNAVPGIGKPSVYHAVVVLFLEFFAWGLLTTPMLSVLKDSFPEHTFLINGLIQGIKGLLSFLSAPLLGALSDVWGRRPFLLLTVIFTCVPIPFMSISPWWFFAMISISGAFAVTFSIVFAYVADITDESSRSTAYGLVSATFAASLVTSPAIGAYLSTMYGDGVVVMLATAIASLDVCFILVAVPESLPGKSRSGSWTSAVSWEQADPFSALKGVGHDPILLLLCVTVFLSYLPEAGQYSCIIVYLSHVIGFSNEKVASYIAVVGVLSIIAQTVVLTLLFQAVGNRNTIIMGLVFQIGQLLFYSFGKVEWTMWAAGTFAALSSINYPALSSFASTLSSSHQQGVAQGLITGIRGLCNGLGPALFGLTFYIFHVELDPDLKLDENPNLTGNMSLVTDTRLPADETILPGPPFLFSAFAVMMAMMIALFIPRHLSPAYKTVSTKEPDALTSKESNNSSFKNILASRTHKKSDGGKLSDSDDQNTLLNDESML